MTAVISYRGFAFGAPRLSPKWTRRRWGRPLLPDIMVVSLVSVRRTPAGFVAPGPHHASVGGTPPVSIQIAEELTEGGMVTPPIKLFERGRLNSAVLDLLIRNMRAPEER